MFNQDKHEVAILHYIPKLGIGCYFIYRFPNGYTAVVMKNEHSFDGYRWHYQFLFEDASGRTYMWPDYLGKIQTSGAWLDEEEIAEKLQEIKSLPIVL